MEIKTNTDKTASLLISKQRFLFGVFLFVCGRLTFLLIPLIRSLSLTAEWKNVLSVFCVFGLPDIFTVLAVAVLGKEGFKAIQDKVFAFLKKYGPPQQVSRSRYRIGLIMFFSPLLLGWLEPYATILFPGYAPNRLVFSIACDLLFLSSLFILGGDFWDKLRSLFIYKPKA